MARLSTRTGDLHASPVREMLNVSQRPGMISFAGGLPSPETFAGLDLPPPPRDLLQYGPTEAEPALRARIAEDLAALEVFRFYGARFEIIDRSAPGAGWADAPPSMAYVIPTFQNPSGHCWTAAERQAMAQACQANDVILFEDDPYRDLVYEPCDRTPVCASLTGGSWIYQGS